MYRIKPKRLKELVAAQGYCGLAKTSLEAQVSVSALEKMCAGTYPAAPKEFLRKRLCKFFNVREADLFELVGAKSKGRAS